VLVLIGLVLGAIGSALAARVLDGLLYGVQARDPLTFLVVALVMVVVGVIATWVPAVRASSIQPVEALRTE